MRLRPAPAETLPALFAGADREALSTVRADLAIVLLSGTDDPLASGGELVEMLAARYRDVGVRDVAVALCTGARHPR